MRVIHCAETIRGGVATYLEELIPLQIECFGLDNVRVIVPSSHAVDLSRVPLSCVEVFVDSASRVWNSLRLLFQLVLLLRRFRPDVVHLHSTFAGFFLRPILGFCRFKVVYCPHGWAFDRSSSPLLVFLVGYVERVLSRFCSVIVCISDHERQRGLQVGLRSSKLKVVHNGISDILGGDVGRNLWPASSSLKLLFVGRFDRQKGIDVLFDALASLGSSVHAVVVGSPVLSDSSVVDPPENATLVGWLSRDEVTPLYAQADLLVVPSRWEGFGIIAIEAMRAGCPVLASRVGGLSEVVEDGVTGILVPPDSPDSIVSAVRSVDRDVLRKMGQRGRRRYELFFSADKMNSKIVDIYRSL